MRIDRKIERDGEGYSEICSKYFRAFLSKNSSRRYFVNNFQEGHILAFGIILGHILIKISQNFSLIF